MAKKKKERIVAVFVEGATEIELYKSIVNYAHKAMGVFNGVSIEYRNIAGIGNYKKDATKEFLKIQRDNPDKDIHVFLCIDTDVFEISKKPPIDKVAIKEKLREIGAKKVVYIEANRSIEDWLLCDYSGVLGFLNLPMNTKRVHTAGLEELRRLFRLKNKTYIKGKKVDGLITSLNIALIISSNCSELKPLCNSIGFKCFQICKTNQDSKEKE